jgi:hypothetical protein
MSFYIEVYNNVNNMKDKPVIVISIMLTNYNYKMHKKYKPPYGTSTHRGRYNRIFYLRISCVYVWICFQLTFSSTHAKNIVIYGHWGALNIDYRENKNKC